MSRFLQALCNKPKGRTSGPGIKEKDLHQWGLAGIQLRSYQMEGVKWLVECYEIQRGCILGDEMGLGKTCQVDFSHYYTNKQLGPISVFPFACSYKKAEKCQRSNQGPNSEVLTAKIKV